MAFSRSCASRGKHQKAFGKRSFVPPRGIVERKNCTRRTSIEHFWRVLSYRGLIGVTTDPEFTLRVPIYSRRWHETVKKDDRHDAARHGTATRLSKRRNDSLTREKIRSTIDRSRIFLRSRDNLSTRRMPRDDALHPLGTRARHSTVRTYVRTYGASESSLDRGKWRKEQEKQGENRYAIASMCVLVRVYLGDQLKA